MRALVNWHMDHMDFVTCEIDGVPVVNAGSYRAESAAFDFTLSDVFVDFGYPPGPKGPAVSDGYWLMLAPPSRGSHTIHFTGQLTFSTAEGDPFDQVFGLEITYELTVGP
ncbi:MAG: hypothetical protein HY721_11200 [Planctomycetes bacterium]|nr:hypothetical protein [Planctomycetota bacterium]